MTITFINEEGGDVVMVMMVVVVVVVMVAVVVVERGVNCGDDEGGGNLVDVDGDAYGGARL